MQVIQLLPLGPVAASDLRFMAETVGRLFRCRPVVLPDAPLRGDAFWSARRQYDADALLEDLFDRLEADVLRVVGITESDLFADGRNFVFGYAHMRDRVAVFSTLRLRERFWERADDEALFRSRVEKALAHELGHTFHAPHCSARGCVMHQVEFLWQLDELLPTYCPRCAALVHRVVAQGTSAPEALFELAGSYMRRRRYLRAAASYAAAAEAAPDNAHYHNDRGVALLTLGDRAGAASAFERAVYLKPSAPHAYYNLGIVNRERGDTVAADWFFRAAVARDADARAAHRYLGILHQDYFKDAPRALWHFEQHVALGGQDPEVLHRLDSLAPPKASESCAPA